MPRNCHYWRRAGAQSTPSEIVVFDCETYFGANTLWGQGELQKLRLGCALAYRLERGRRTRVKRLTFRTPQDFWGLVTSRLNKRRPVWVFGHNIAYDLGCVGGWRFIQSPGFRAEKVAVSGQIFYLKGHTDKGAIIFCDTLNYYRCSLRSLGKAVGVPKMDMPHIDAPDAEWERYCANDVDVTAAGVDALIRFIRENMLGPWQPSIAGLAFSAYRSCFMADKVLVHNTWPVLRLERGSYYGGLVDTPRLGRVPASRVWELDVCSMYPAMCLKPLPIRLKGWSDRCSAQRLRTLAADFQVCADVEVVTNDTPYPVRQRRGTYYPIGRYRTCLAHPELMEAIERGHVRYVHRAAWYVARPIFAGYMQWFVDLKTQYRSEGDEAFSTLCKYYANSLYGKTGQLTPRWQEWGDESLQILEAEHGLASGTWERYYRKPPDLYELEETVRMPGSAKPIEVRNYYGTVEVKCGESESRESCPIIAATVTSYARCLLRGYQRTAGPGHWFYSDTDSIWVDDVGLANLTAAGCVRPDTLGYLSVKGSHDYMVVHGPKDYETPTIVRRKGVRADATPTADGGWCQLQFPGAMIQMRDGVTDGVYVRHVTKHLRRELTKSHVGPDGSTRPLVFPAENPEVAARGKSHGSSAKNR